METKNLKIDNAEIAFRNFSGKEGKFNPAGRRNFCVILDEDIAKTLVEDGWNIKYLKPRDETENPKPYMQVAVSYDVYPPNIFLVTSRGKNRLNSDTIDILDWAEIKHADLIIRPYNWELNGKKGTKAYVKTLYVVIEEDEFEEKYSQYPDSAQNTVGGCGNCDACDGSCHE
ncbi:hypothetical protein [Turicimonas muris]|uniref:hypothetical protein n=1 Tax=Turicimonas muris TaxID=1796652 RepID=UPI002617419E|nr:hypothetical protein [Turicimonas muris]